MLEQKKAFISAQAEIPLHLQQKKGGIRRSPQGFLCFLGLLKQPNHIAA